MHFYLGFFPNQKRCYACVLLQRLSIAKTHAHRRLNIITTNANTNTHTKQTDIQPEQIAKIGSNNKELNSHFRFDT